MNGGQKTILLIDDEADLVESIKTILASKGYRVLTAYNGIEGLQQLEKNSPHLIILDMNMPKMGGIAFYHEIANSSDGTPKFPVLVLTARANLEQLFKDFSVDGFMTKPFEIAHLLKEVEIIISKRYGAVSSAVSADRAKVEREKLPKKVLVVEDNQDFFNKIVIAFLNDGYVVDSVKTGVAVIERAMVHTPDVILMKLGLSDLSGDIVAMKLKQMPKTMDIPILLYTPENKDLNYDVARNICSKIGIRTLVESNDPYVLLKETSRLLQKEP